jgi:hypothetical protein
MVNYFMLASLFAEGARLTIQKVQYIDYNANIFSAAIFSRNLKVGP